MIPACNSCPAKDLSVSSDLAMFCITAYFLYSTSVIAALTSSMASMMIQKQEFSYN